MTKISRDNNDRINRDNQNRKRRRNHLGRRQRSQLTRDLVQIQQEIFEGVTAVEVFNHFANPVNLRAAWHKVRTTPGASSAGPDGISCDEMSKRIVQNLKTSIRQLKSGQYNFGPTRKVNLAKSDGSFREIGILNVRDRIVVTALKQILEPILDPQFAANSHGFRPKRSVSSSLHQVRSALQDSTQTDSPWAFVVQVDVSKCFARIQHSRLFKKLKQMQVPKRMMTVVQSAVSSQASGKVGLLQGSSLSPLLCNAYLDQLDQRVEKFSRPVHYCRYADDICLLVQNKNDASAALQYLNDLAKQLGLELGQQKSKITSAAEGFEWLGARLSRHPAERLGFVNWEITTPEHQLERMLLRIKAMTEIPHRSIAGDAINLEKWIGSINVQLRQWREAYLFTDNSAWVFKELDRYARYRVGLLISSVTGLRKTSARDKFLVPIANGFWTWKVKNSWLLILSALPPKNPRRFARNPDWYSNKMTNATNDSPNQRIGAQLAPLRRLFRSLGSDNSWQKLKTSIAKNAYEWSQTARELAVRLCDFVSASATRIFERKSS